MIAKIYKMDFLNYSQEKAKRKSNRTINTLEALSLVTSEMTFHWVQGSTERHSETTIELQEILQKPSLLLKPGKK